jgi:hypothetical protein
MKPALNTGSVCGERFNEPGVKATFICILNLRKSFSLFLNASWKTKVAATVIIVL